MLRILRTSVITALAALALTDSAQAAGGDYVFDGGSSAARSQVRAALDASSFDWNLVPLEITIHIKRGVKPHATPGDIWIDENLLGSGRFAWGIVQHEYAHQVAFLLFGKSDRAELKRSLGGDAWCHEKSGVDHDGNTCERFAHTLAWSYWTSKDNVERSDAVMPAAKFRKLVDRLVSA